MKFGAKTMERLEASIFVTETTSWAVNICKNLIRDVSVPQHVINGKKYKSHFSCMYKVSPDEVGEDDPVQFRKFLDKTDCKFDVLPDGDGVVVAGSVRDERDVELAQPLLEQGCRHMGIRWVATLPLVEPAFYTCHLNQ